MTMQRRNLLVGIASSPLSVSTWAKLLPDVLGTRPRPPDDRAAARFERAQEFARGLDRHIGGDVRDFLYYAGIVTQLGLTAYLFDRGLDDDWCRDRIGLDVAKALAFANHLGLGCDCRNVGELAALISPYGKWRRPFGTDLPDVNIIRPTTAVSDVGRLLDLVEHRIGFGETR